MVDISTNDKLILIRDATGKPVVMKGGNDAATDDHLILGCFADGGKFVAPVGNDIAANDQIAKGAFIDGIPMVWKTGGPAGETCGGCTGLPSTVTVTISDLPHDDDPYWCNSDWSIYNRTWTLNWVADPSTAPGCAGATGCCMWQSDNLYDIDSSVFNWYDADNCYMVLTNDTGDCGCGSESSCSGGPWMLGFVGVPIAWEGGSNCDPTGYYYSCSDCGGCDCENCVINPWDDPWNWEFYDCTLDATVIVS